MVQLRAVIDYRLIFCIFFGILVMVASPLSQSDSRGVDKEISPLVISYEYNIDKWNKSVKFKAISKDSRLYEFNISLDKKTLINKKTKKIISGKYPYIKDVEFIVVASKDYINYEYAQFFIELKSGDDMRDIINRKNEISRALIIKIKINGKIKIEYIEMDKDSLSKDILYDGWS